MAPTQKIFVLNKNFLYSLKKEMESLPAINLERLAFLPIINHELDAIYQEQKRIMWTAQHVDYAEDRKDWDGLDEATKTYISFLLALFAQLDGLINANLVDNFKRETASLAKECSAFYAYQEAIEWTHNETYSLLINANIRDVVERDRMLNSIQNYPSINKIAMWALRWMDSSLPLPERVIAFCCIEGIVFSSAFAGIYWIKRMNKLKGLTKANEWIARDEAIHTKFGVTLYHHMISKWKTHERVSEQRVHEIIRSAVDITEDFTRNAMNTDLVGLNADQLIGYVKCTADTLSTSLGYQKIYSVPNPLEWMVIIALPNMTNFFESRVTEYSDVGKDDEIDWGSV